MKKYISFCLLFLLSPALFAQTNKPVSPWEKEIAAFEASDRTNPPPKHAILFVGSSTIRLWKLQKNFPGRQVINRGFGGSQIADVNEFADRIVFPYEPRLIVFYSGDNDLQAGKSVDRVFADFQEFVRKVHARLPDTEIACISIKPCPSRWKNHEKVMSVNAKIAAMHDPKLKFIDAYPLMLGADGKPRPELFLKDGLHPSAKCYQLWAGKIKPLLD
jgi:lysophospholipase L1-like esterase